MNELIEFINSSYISISIIVFIVLGLLVVISIYGINLNKSNPKPKLIQEVTVETFEENVEKIMANKNEDLDNLRLLPSESFCDSYLGNSAELEMACNQLTETNCAEAGCCVFTKTGSKCVAGDVHGPTYKTDKSGNLITLDSYYYLGKCYGNCSK